MTTFALSRRARGLILAATMAAGLTATRPGLAAEFSVTPIRVELKSGVLTDTITVTNHAANRLRVSVKLQEWTQDATGNDVYKDSADLVYFPRQLELEPEARKLVRVGIKQPAGTVEKTYRLFIEEEPQAAGSARSQVAFYFRFGVPIFLPPAVPRAQPEVAEPKLQAGKVSVMVRNPGNQHFRLTRLGLSDGEGFSKEIAGWYSLAGSERTYTVEVPPEICRKARTLNLALEAEGFRIDRKLHVDPANCA